MENQQLTAFIAIDLSAAINTVDHDILLNVLTAKFNVTGTALKLLESHLRPRYCKVAVNGYFSSNKELKFSVPQGSCAGPVLYTAYSSTMAEVVLEHISIHGYADDHGLKKSYRPVHQEEDKIIKILEKCAVEIKAWMDKNRLCINSNKTEYITFRSSRQLKKNEIRSSDINGDIIAGSTCIRYLRVWVDQQLNFKHHIAQKCKIAMLNIQRLKQIRKFLTKEADVL